MEQTKILVVDDEARMRKLVKDFLTIKGYQVIEAGDGEEAVEIFFQQKDIALILLGFNCSKSCCTSWTTSSVSATVVSSFKKNIFYSSC